MLNPAIGLIVMSASANIERAFHRDVPPTVDVVVSRVPFHNLSYLGLLEMIERLPDTAKLLMEARPYAIAVPSVTASFIKGNEIVNLVQQATGVPVLVPALEFLKLFKSLGIKKVGIVSVYSTELELVEKAFFSTHNIAVETVIHVENKVNMDPYLISSVPVESLIEAAAEADFSGVDAVIFDNSFFDFREGDIERLEACIGKPVFSPNNVLLYAALKEIGASTAHLSVSRYFNR